MDYKDKYNKALERASKLRVQNPFDTVGQMVEYIFPELLEDNDESIRKALKQGFFEYGNSFTTFGGITVGDIIAWLEKQDKQQSTAYGHKFREGDIVKSKSRPMLDARKIVSIDKDRYCYWCEDKSCLGFAWEDDYELVEQQPTDNKEKLEVLKFIRKETCCGLAEANNALLKLIKVLKEHPHHIMDKPCKLKIEWEE